MKRLFLFAAILLCLPVSGQKLTSPFDPARARLISESDNCMSHAPSTAIADDGTVFVAYYRDKEQLVEDAGNTSIELVLDRFSARKWKTSFITRYPMMKAGQTVGDFTQILQAPYDPLLQIEGNTLHCIFQGNETSPKDRIYVKREFDISKGAFKDEIKRCTLSWGDTTALFTVSSLKKCYQHFGIANPRGMSSAVLDKVLVKHGDWYYSPLSCWCCLEAKPLVVRTKDLVNFEVVFICPEFGWGSTESSIAILDDEIYLMARTGRPKDKARKGVWIAKYSMDGKCLVKPYKIGNVESRMAMVTNCGRVWSFCNVTPEMRTAEGKVVRRSRVKISELDRNAQPLREWTVGGSHSVQYYNITPWKGKWYFTFVEDRKFRKISQCKGDISFTDMILTPAEPFL